MDHRERPDKPGTFGYAEHRFRERAGGARVLDILRLGEGTAEAEKWAKACTLSGECMA